MRGWLLSRRKGKGGERRAGAKVGPWAAKKLVRTGDRRGRCFGSGRTREKTQCNWVKSALVWVELSRGFYRISKMGGQIESGLWGFRFSLALGVRVLDLAKCDYILLRMGGFPAPTV